MEPNPNSVAELMEHDFQAKEKFIVVSSSKSTRKGKFSSFLKMVERSVLTPVDTN